MRNAFAIARRVLSQFAHDKRTLALLFVAPIVVLWLLSVLLGSDAYEPRLATVDLPASFQTALEGQDARIVDTTEAEAERLLRANEADAVLRMRDDATLELWAEGSDSAKTAAAANVVAKALSEAQQEAADEMEADVEERKAAIEEALAVQGAAASPLAEKLDGLDFDMAAHLPVQDVETTYLHGTEDWKMFDFYGPVFIGIFVFAFVFLTSGMSLVNERGAGTMTRFLATPVKPAQILGGYTAGFGLLALAQGRGRPVHRARVHRLPQRGTRLARRVRGGVDGTRLGHAGAAGVGPSQKWVPSHPAHAAVRGPADPAVRAVRPRKRAGVDAGAQPMLPHHLRRGRAARHHAARRRFRQRRLRPCYDLGIHRALLRLGRRQVPQEARIGAIRKPALTPPRGGVILESA